jgi:sulfate permease, SulP family
VIAGASAADAAPRRLREELDPKRLVPTVTFGVVLGVLEIVLAISLAALIFGGRLSAHLEAGIGLGLLSAVVTMVPVAPLPSHSRSPRRSGCALLHDRGSRW